MATQAFSRKLLERVAAQMNDVMGLNPAIDVNGADDGTLLDSIRWEATGRGKIGDAIRADDFVSDNPNKKLFADDVYKFFVDLGVWDDKKQVAIISKKTEPKAAAPAEAPAEPEERPGVEERLETVLEEELAAKGPAAETPAPQKPAKTRAGKTSPAASTRKAPEAKKEAPVKSAEKKAAKKEKADKKDSGPSNKMLVYQAWKNGKGETDVTKLAKHVKGAVKESTIRNWISGWAKKKNLPGGAKK